MKIDAAIVTLHEKLINPRTVAMISMHWSIPKERWFRSGGNDIARPSFSSCSLIPPSLFLSFSSSLFPSYRYSRPRLIRRVENANRRFSRNFKLIFPSFGFLTREDKREDEGKGRKDRGRRGRRGGRGYIYLARFNHERLDFSKSTYWRGVGSSSFSLFHRINPRVGPIYARKIVQSWVELLSIYDIRWRGVQGGEDSSWDFNLGSRTPSRMWKTWGYFWKDQRILGLIGRFKFSRISQSYEISWLINLDDVVFPRRHERFTWIAKIVYVASSNAMNTFNRVVLLALENLFSHIGMDDQLRIWERKTWIVAERSWDVSASCNPVFSSLGKRDISFAFPQRRLLHFRGERYAFIACTRVVR